MRALIAIALACFVGPVSSEPRQRPEGPKVESEKQAERPANARRVPEASERLALCASASVPPVEAKPPEPKREHGGEEGAEFLSFVGLRLKITDMLLVVFTFLLWVSTHRLWKEAVAASGTAKISADTAKAHADAIMSAERAWLSLRFLKPGLKKSGIQLAVVEVSVKDTGRIRFPSTSLAPIIS